MNHPRWRCVAESGMGNPVIGGVTIGLFAALLVVLSVTRRKKRGGGVGCNMGDISGRRHHHTLSKMHREPHFKGWLFFPPVTVRYYLSNENHMTWGRSSVGRARHWQC